MISPPTKTNAPHRAKPTEAQGKRKLDFVLPPLPSTLAEALQIRKEGGSNPDTQRLINLVRSDAVTAAYVLKRVNSPYYGLRRKTSDLERAIHMLGFTEVCNLVVAAGMKKLAYYQQDASAYKIYDRIMRASIGTAAYCHFLAESLNIPMREMAFSAGLLHQIGRLVLLNSAPDLYEPLWQPEGAAPDELVAPSPMVEQRLFGIGAPALGALTLQRWSLPNELAIAVHHIAAPEAVTDAQVRPLVLALAASAVAATAILDVANDDELEQRVQSPWLDELTASRMCETSDVTRLFINRRDKVLIFTSSMLGD